MAQTRDLQTVAQQHGAQGLGHRLGQGGFRDRLALDLDGVDAEVGGLQEGGNPGALVGILPALVDRVAR